ncbi:MAG: DNA polymerase III subunit delta' C-terminal domain-containing protein [Nevskiales bacterium]
MPWQQQHWQTVGTAIQQNRLAHALLLVGPHGIGKRHFAAVLAQSVLCARRDEKGLPCGTCQSCVWVQAGTHPDFFRLEKEEGSKVVKVDDLREFNRKIFLTPQLGHGIVGVIDPVDGLNRSSANAVLKSLEEPPRGTHILLVGTRWLSLPATIRSRCIIMRFPLPSAELVRQWLAGQSLDSIEIKSMRDRYEPDTAKRHGWMEALAGACLGKDDPVFLAERWHKLEGELPELLDWMHGCVADLIKLKTGASETNLLNYQSFKSLQAMAARFNLRTLQDLSGLGVETRRLLETQAKPQMLLENLLASWYQGSGSGQA